MVDLLYLAVITLIAAGIGGRVLRKLQVDCADLTEEAVFDIGIGYGIFAYLMFAGGLLGVIYRPVVYGMLTLGMLLSWNWLVGIKALRGSKRVELRWPRDGMTFLISSLLFLAIVANFVGTLAPLSSSDALRYHFAAPKIWLKQNQMVEIPWDWATYQPFNVQMLFMMGMALHSDILGALFHWLFGVLIIGALFSFCKRYLKDVSQVLAAAIFYISGLVAWESTSGYVELGSAFFSLLAFYAFMNWAYSNDATGWLALSGVFAGLAAGTKYTGAVMTVLLVIALGGYLARQRRLGEIFTPLLALTVPAFLLVVPWYLKNFIQTGDPAYPFLSTLMGREGFQTLLTNILSQYGYGKGLTDFVAFPFRLTFDGEAFDKGYLLGPLYLSFIPFLVLLKDKQVVSMVSFFIVVYGLFWFLTSQQARFLLPMLPLLAACCAASARLLESYDGMVRVATKTVLMVALTFGCVVTLFYNTQFIPVVFGFESKEMFLTRKTWFYQDIEWMNSNLPENARILFLAHEGYYLDRDYIDLDRAYEPRVDPKSEGFRTWFDQNQITHVYCLGQSCQEFLASRVPFKALREGIAEIFESRTLRRKLTQIRTAVLERVS